MRKAYLVYGNCGVFREARAWMVRGIKFSYLQKWKWIINVKHTVTRVTFYRRNVLLMSDTYYLHILVYFFIICGLCVIYKPNLHIIHTYVGNFFVIPSIIFTYLCLIWFSCLNKGLILSPLKIFWNSTHIRIPSHHFTRNVLNYIER